MITTIFGMMVTLIIGLFFLKIINFEANWYEKVAVAFLISIGLQTVLFFLLSSTLDKVTSSLYWIFLLAIFVGELFVCKILKKEFIFHIPRIKKEFTKTFIFSIGIWLAIFLLFLITLIYALYTPVHTTDSITLYDFRAKAMFISQTVSSIKNIKSWYTYPMFTSMVNLQVRLMGFDNPSFVYPLMYLAFAAVFYSFLREKTSNLIASLGTLSMYSTPLILWQSLLDGLTNLPYTIFLCSSIFYVIKLDPKKLKFSYIFISILFAGLSTWTRGNEPFWLIPLLLIFLKVIFNIKHLIIFLLLFPLVLSFRNIWSNYVGTINYISTVSGTVDLLKDIAIAPKTEEKVVPKPKVNKFFEAAKFTFPVVLESLNPAIYIYLLFIPIYFYKREKKQTEILIVTTGVFLILFVGVMYVQLNFKDWSLLDNSLSRISGLLIPLMWVFVFLSEIWIDIEAQINNIEI